MQKKYNINTEIFQKSALTILLKISQFQKKSKKILFFVLLFRYYCI